jgi:hypothetical protein
MNIKTFYHLAISAFILLGFAEVAAKKNSLFNGTDLTGWKIPKGNENIRWYQAKKGILELRSGPQKKGISVMDRKRLQRF